MKFVTVVDEADDVDTFNMLLALQVSKMALRQVEDDKPRGKLNPELE